MTFPTSQPRVEPDAAAVNEYLMQQLTAQIKETALTWGALQKLHQERAETEAVLEQQRDAARAEAQRLHAELQALREPKEPKEPKVLDG